LSTRCGFDRLADDTTDPGKGETDPGEEVCVLKELIGRTRSYRRFDQIHRVPGELLDELVGLARLSASGANLQPLKYILSCDPGTNQAIFPTLGWAAYLKGWPGPADGERPTAYIVVLLDTEISKSAGVDHGIACQNILLGAVERGFGGCMIATINREALRRILEIPERYEILLVVALGRPAEQVVVDDMEPGQDIKYYRDPEGVHHVPKRRLEEIVLRRFG
jgi:nitroreductase